MDNAVDKERGTPTLARSGSSGSFAVAYPSDVACVIPGDLPPCVNRSPARRRRKVGRDGSKPSIVIEAPRRGTAAAAASAVVCAAGGRRRSAANLDSRKICAAQFEFGQPCGGEDCSTRRPEHTPPAHATISRTQRSSERRIES
ncbi:hypothetical protein AXG93_1130s1470 [Marchantia polymorpha subsp. ruderalis]|uniref:Uncharacterized protein n=1 Tax=Marchantia polymorpha subsp. ruderalis TaxID=1480154 RepID=A0A176VG68_MARPO|nr:hypothetical protein AXG93_1130s1470 [Marchantia polymorpha subsp. ruderalis]